MANLRSKGIISFAVIHNDFKLKKRTILKECITSFIHSSGFALQTISFVFCNDEYLAQINKKYLNHNTFTDIVTFDYKENKETLSGDIIISIDRVIENAKKFKVSFNNELYRVISHGILHLMGNSDHSKSERVDMRAKEDDALKFYDKLT